MFTLNKFSLGVCFLCSVSVSPWDSDGIYFLTEKFLCCYVCQPRGEYQLIEVRDPAAH